MAQITNDHAEWAVVGRLRRMLEEEPPHQQFNVTQTYALFTTIICWVTQHIRIPDKEIKTLADQSAHKLLQTLSQAAIANDPWHIQVAPMPRIERIGSHTVKVPAPVNFEAHSVDRFLINLRDATDTAMRESFRHLTPSKSQHLLAGFHFKCAEIKDRRRTWEGKITLLEQDMRRIGIELAKMYCNAIRRSETNRQNNHFGTEAASIKETAA